MNAKYSSKYFQFACFLIILIACKKKPTNPTPIAESPKQIKSIIESIHDPIENDQHVDPQSSISEDTFIIKSYYNQKGKLLRIDKYNSRGSMEWREIYKYDQEGNNIERQLFQLKEISNKTINTFNANNQLIERNEFDANSKRIRRQTTKMDQDGSRIVTLFEFINGAFVKSSEGLFDKTNHNVGNRHYSRDHVTNREINRFDLKGNLIESVQTYPLRNEEWTTHYKYDSANNILEKVLLNRSLMIESKVNYAYDDKGNVVKVYYYGVAGNLKEYESHRYVYDEQGNWIKDIAFLNKKPISVTIRSMEYYQASL